MRVSDPQHGANFKTKCMCFTMQSGRQTLRLWTWWKIKNPTNSLGKSSESNICVLLCKVGMRRSGLQHGANFKTKCMCFTIQSGRQMLRLWAWRKNRTPSKHEVNSDWKKSYADSSASLWPQRGEGKVHIHCKNTYVLMAFGCLCFCSQAWQLSVSTAKQWWTDAILSGENSLTLCFRPMFAIRSGCTLK